MNATSQDVPGVFVDATCNKAKAQRIQTSPYNSWLMKRQCSMCYDYLGNQQPLPHRHNLSPAPELLAPGDQKHSWTLVTAISRQIVVRRCRCNRGPFDPVGRFNRESGHTMIIPAAIKNTPRRIKEGSTSMPRLGTRLPSATVKAPRMAAHPLVLAAGLMHKE